MKFPRFLAGLFLGAVAGLIFWYWQKSTSADEGALALLDRLAAAELRVRDLEARLRIADKSKPKTEKPELLAGLSDLWGLEMSEEGSPLDQQGSSQDLIATNENGEKLAKDDLQVINGIGPAYERRLNEAGIFTYSDLAHQTSDQLRQIVDLKSWHAADPQQWIDEAQARLQG